MHGDVVWFHASMQNIARQRATTTFSVSEPEVDCLKILRGVPRGPRTFVPNRVLRPELFPVYIFLNENRSAEILYFM